MFLGGGGRCSHEKGRIGFRAMMRGRTREKRTEGTVCICICMVEGQTFRRFGGSFLIQCIVFLPILLYCSFLYMLGFHMIPQAPRHTQYTLYILSVHTLHTVLYCISCIQPHHDIVDPIRT